jgi:hypothetical protein
LILGETHKYLGEEGIVSPTWSLKIWWKKNVCIYKGRKKRSIVKMVTLNESRWWIYRSLICLSYSFFVLNDFKWKVLKSYVSLSKERELSFEELHSLHFNSFAQNLWSYL